MTTEDRILANIEDYYAMARDLREECKEYITSFVKKYGKHHTKKDKDIYDLDLYNDEIDDYYGGDSISCSYDGGNHPEYASNAFATIYEVAVINDKIHLVIEDCDDYDVDYVLTDDIINIAEHLIGIEDELKENAEKQD